MKCIPHAAQRTHSHVPLMQHQQNCYGRARDAPHHRLTHRHLSCRPQHTHAADSHLPGLPGSKCLSQCCPWQPGRLSRTHAEHTPGLCGGQGRAGWRRCAGWAPGDRWPGTPLYPSLSCLHRMLELSSPKWQHCSC